MTTRRVALASFIFLALLASFSLLPVQTYTGASAQEQQPQRATPETPQFGRLEISTSPGGYPLSINGQPFGETTASNRLIDLPPGEYRIEVAFPGGQRWVRDVSIRGGERKCIALVYRSPSPGAASPETPPTPSSTHHGEFGQDDISGGIVDCGATATTRGGRVPAAEQPLILRQYPPGATLPPVTSPQEALSKKSAPPKTSPQKTSPRVIELSPPPPPPPPLPPGTATPAQQQTEPPKSVDDKSKNEDYTVVPIFYGTDRARTGAKEPKDFYGAGRGQLEMGTCEVSIPKTHQRGQLESPSIWRLEFKEDPKLHVVLLSVKPLATSEFNSQFQTRLGAAKSRDVFVFVHGYNVKFVDAARRTAQLAYDLQFPGVPVLYSWPSQGSLSGYTMDEAAVERSEQHLKKFLADLAALGAGARIHLIAHSMGNRALTRVLRDLAHTNTTPLFSEVILTAPDIDAEVFEQQLAPAIQKIARRVTLYASSSDAALLASKTVHGYQRAGDSLPEIIVVPGIDTIDASGIDTDMLGHSYFAQMKVVMDDMNLLLIASKLPGERSLLEQVRGANKYWRLPGAIVGTDGQRPGIIPGARFLTLRNGLILAALFGAFVAVAVWLVLRARRRRAPAL